jgi:hypothetical protein
VNFKDAFIAKAQKYNHYEETEKIPGRKCDNCIRGKLSYPYTCKDYSRIRHDNYYAETCLNYTEDPNCPVD